MFSPQYESANVAQDEYLVQSQTLRARLADCPVPGRVHFFVDD